MRENFTEPCAIDTLHRKKYRTRQASTLRAIAIQVAPLNKTHVRVPAQPHEALTRSVGPRGGSVARRWRYTPRAPLQRTLAAHTHKLNQTHRNQSPRIRAPPPPRNKIQDSRLKWSSLKTKLLSAERRFVIIPEYDDNVSRKIKNNESQIIQEAWHFDARLAQGPLAIGPLHASRLPCLVIGGDLVPPASISRAATRPVPVLLSVAVLARARVLSRGTTVGRIHAVVLYPTEYKLILTQ